jgi:hypothetical protein
MVQMDVGVSSKARPVQQNSSRTSTAHFLTRLYWHAYLVMKMKEHRRSRAWNIRFPTEVSGIYDFPQKKFLPLGPISSSSQEVLGLYENKVFPRSLLGRSNTSLSCIGPLLKCLAVHLGNPESGHFVLIYHPVFWKCPLKSLLCHFLHSIHLGKEII